jgi:Lrp/AsnC family transcriptional regulator, leucine-responsive regulatory protein
LKITDIKIMSVLRKNSRQPLTKISRQTKIPVSTIYDRIKTHEGSIIKKHTSILDFPKLGYNIRLYLLLKSRNRQDMQEFLRKHPNVNSAFLIEGNYDFIIDCIFKEMLDMQNFMELVDKTGIITKETHFVTNEFTRENFMNGDEKNEFIWT